MRGGSGDRPAALDVWMIQRVPGSLDDSCRDIRMPSAPALHDSVHRDRNDGQRRKHQPLDMLIQGK